VAQNEYAALGSMPFTMPFSTDPTLNITAERAAAGNYELSFGLIWWIFGMVLAIGYFILCIGCFAAK
jgi:cytochrome d ubiquinol oxidase subunit II